jgi:hypothetical protein
MLSDLGSELRALQLSIMRKTSEVIAAEISKEVIQKSILSEARRARADFRSGKVYEDLAVKVKERFIKGHLEEWIDRPSLDLVEETCSQAGGMRIEKRRKDMEEKQRYEREKKEFEQNKVKMLQDLAEMKLKVEQSDRKAADAKAKAEELEKKNEELEKENRLLLE